MVLTSFTKKKTRFLKATNTNIIHCGSAPWFINITYIAAIHKRLSFIITHIK